MPGVGLSPLPVQMAVGFTVLGGAMKSTNRYAERGVLDRLVEAVRAGESRALALSGEPDVGKTALLDYLAQQAADYRITRATGVRRDATATTARRQKICGYVANRTRGQLVEGTVMHVKRVNTPDTAGESSVPALRIVVAEDEVLLRVALCSLLTRSGFDVVGQAGTRPELLAQVTALKPDLVVVDIRMPPTHSTEGLDAARIIREQQPHTGILVLSAHLDVDHAMELMINGSRVGYLLKSRVADVADFIDALERIAKGASVVDPSLMREVLNGRRHADPLDALSPREQQVLALMAQGRSNGGIARRLWLAEATVEKHVRSILTKLNLAQTDDDHRRVRAVITYLEAG